MANPENSYIELNYRFIVGYKAFVNNIRETQIPATTYCALLHKNDNDEYNYSDFGVYEIGGALYPEKMFYNGGTAYTEVFGVAALKSVTGTMLD
jgi:hypothetical protein